jgi:hypothetical protein
MKSMVVSPGGVSKETSRAASGFHGQAPGKKNAPGQKLLAKGDAQERETVR